jgi:methionyl aminopeptidase
MNARAKQEFISGMRQAGFAAAHAIKITRQAVEPGISTLELDDVCADALRAFSARSAAISELNAPCHAFFSVNDVVSNGLPSNQPLANGDVLTINVLVERDGFMSDVATTVSVGLVSERVKRLIDCGRFALERAIEVRHDIAHTISFMAREQGFHIIRGSGGHGIGRKLQQAPDVPNEVGVNPQRGSHEWNPFKTIEPTLCMGMPQTVIDDNGWNTRTRDGSLAVHFAHTVMPVGSGLEILTGP